MSKHQQKHVETHKVTSPDGAEPTKPMVLMAPVRTTKGYAVAKAIVAPDGSLISISLGHSQEFKQFIALEHHKALAVAANSI